MLSSASFILGGLGLFLLGMSLLTDGLTALSGSALRRYLASCTSSLRRAVLSGAGATAIVQSSSATTLATIGFVSAGLLSFESAIGIVIGANIGTTSTGWIVSLLGLKLSIGKIALPMVGVGALMRLLGKGRKLYLGTAIAGFGLIFVGIDALQSGMQGLSEYLNPADYAFAGMGGRLVLALVGVLMTVVMQSSSAAVATTLTALAGGALTLEQAAALVVGQNVGTTVTALIAAVGASAPAKRTALVHVIFNLTTGAIAFLILPGFIVLVTLVLGDMAAQDHALAIAAFHTAFNLMGALIFIPLTPLVATWVRALIREEESDMTRHLHPGLQQLPDAAISAGRDALVAFALRLLEGASSRTLGAAPTLSYAELHKAADRMAEFLTQAPMPAGQADSLMQRRIALLHALDNMVVLLEELKDPVAVEEAVDSTRLGPELKRVSATLGRICAALAQEGRLDPVAVETLFSEYMQAAKASRPAILADMAAGQIRTSEALRDLAVQRWLERLLRHLWRAVTHLEEATDDYVWPTADPPTGESATE